MKLKIEIGQTIEGETIGHRTVCGTEWPVFRQLRKISKRKYSVTTICNGVGEHYQEFVGLNRALEAL